MDFYEAVKKLVEENNYIEPDPKDGHIGAVDCVLCGKEKSYDWDFCSDKCRVDTIGGK